MFRDVRCLPTSGGDKVVLSAGAVQLAGSKTIDVASRPA